MYKGIITYSRAALIALALFTIGIHTPARAADHNDSPAVGGSSRSYLDVTDVFAFRSPDDESRLTIVIGHFSPEVAGTADLFRSDGRYEISIDTNKDFSADERIMFSFDAPEADGKQSYRVTGLPGNLSTIGITTTDGSEPSVSTVGDARVFAGLADDPFFFDLDGFKGFTSAPCIPASGLRCAGTGSPVNFFLGRNIAALVVDFPITSLEGISSPDSGNVHVWAKTFEQLAD